MQCDSPLSEHIVELLSVVCVTVHSVREKHIEGRLLPKRKRGGRRRGAGRGRESEESEGKEGG